MTNDFERIAREIVEMWAIEDNGDLFGPKLKNRIVAALECAEARGYRRALAEAIKVAGVFFNNGAFESSPDHFRGDGSTIPPAEVYLILKKDPK